MLEDLFNSAVTDFAFGAGWYILVGVFLVAKFWGQLIWGLVFGFSDERSRSRIPKPKKPVEVTPDLRARDHIERHA